MSIILKGIDLDEITAGNGYARLEIEEDGTVVDDISDIIIGYAIQIPKGHGRLIDGDKLLGEFIDWQYTEAPDHLNTKEGKMVTDHERQYELYLALGEAVIEIANAPTILEAEE